MQMTLSNASLQSRPLYGKPGRLKRRQWRRLRCWKGSLRPAEALWLAWERAAASAGTCWIRPRWGLVAVNCYLYDPSNMTLSWVFLRTQEMTWHGTSISHVRARSGGLISAMQGPACVQEELHRVQWRTGIATAAVCVSTFASIVAAVYARIMSRKVQMSPCCRHPSRVSAVSVGMTVIYKRCAEMNVLPPGLCLA